MIDVAIRKKLGAFALDVAFISSAGVTALFGRSGAGKSTIVKAIAGLVRPDAGTIRMRKAGLMCRRSDGASASCFKMAVCFRI